MASYDPLRVLRVRLLITGGGDGDRDSNLCLGLIGGDGVRLLYIGGGEGEVSSLYSVPLSVIPVGMGGDLDPSRYTPVGGV